MAQLWFDTVASRPLESPVWLGTLPAGLEIINAGGRCLLIDARAADGTAFGPAVAGPAQDFAAHFLYRDLRPAARDWQIGGLGIVLRYVDADNYVEVVAGSGASANIGNVRERLVGSSIDTQIPALFTSAPGGWRHLRVQLVGGTVRVRGWDDGAAEPATWAAEHTLTGLVFTPGGARVSLPFAAGGAVELGYLAIGTAGDAPPTGPMRVINGVVEDEQGLPASSRRVRAYWRDTGALVGEGVSDPVTGAFSIPAEHVGEYTVVCLDDEIGLVENDYAARVLV